MLKNRRDAGQSVENLVLGQQTRPCREHKSPILSLTLINPQQAVAHRLIEVRRPKIGRAPELAIPGMRIFVRQQITHISVLVPLGEVSGRRSVFAGAMMLETDSTKAIRQ